MPEIKTANEGYDVEFQYHPARMGHASLAYYRRNSDGAVFVLLTEDHGRLTKLAGPITPVNVNVPPTEFNGELQPVPAGVTLYDFRPIGGCWIANAAGCEFRRLY